MSLLDYLEEMRTEKIRSMINNSTLTDLSSFIKEPKTMTLYEYQEFTKTTAVYPKGQAMEYLICGLVSEAGEVAGKYKKLVRGDYKEKEIAFDHDLEKELGDVFWYLSELCNVLGISIETVLYMNKEKLEFRQKHDTLKGDGDDR